MAEKYGVYPGQVGQCGACTEVASGCPIETGSNGGQRRVQRYIACVINPLKSHKNHTSTLT